MSAEVRLRPLAGPWPYPPTPRRRTYQFRSTWHDTKKLLASEAELLGAELVVVEFDVVGGEAAFRLNGELRANAAAGDFPGVRVSMETRHGPLTYATDRYEKAWGHQKLASWQANVRAIAMSLEALRAVDRHGVTRSGEQYRGWRAIEAGGSTSRFATADEAARWMRAQAIRLGHVGLVESGELLTMPQMADSVYKLLVRRMHPDVGGDAADWAALDEAWQLLAERVGAGR